jgi:transcriptional regulator with XRE-family HTH domain
MPEMRDVEVARAFRAVRLRRGWRQLDVARRTGLSQTRISDLEAGDIGSFPLATLRRVGAVLEIDVTVAARWRGGELARLLDADHAALQSAIAHRFQRHAWEVLAERTFSHVSERGSIDLLARHPSTGVVAVIEIKTVVVDLQDLLARLDAKTRLAPTVAAPLGWRPTTVVPCLFVTASTTARRRLVDHAPLFARFDVRGSAVRSWIQTPGPAGGLLALVSPPLSSQAAVRRAGRRRVRSRRLAASLR